MILKIKRGNGFEYVECDRVEFRHKPAEVGSAEMPGVAAEHIWALCHNKDRIDEYAFQSAYLMENGKTIDHISILVGTNS